MPQTLHPPHESRGITPALAEYTFQGPPLFLPDLTDLPKDEELAQFAAGALFLQRAQTTLPDFQLTQHKQRDESVYSLVSIDFFLSIKYNLYIVSIDFGG
jgi:hypothetical protein